jgi:hypothetical protein
MSCFGNCASTSQQKSPDPTKHVLYSQGMVLGVDDFNQEFAYLANRDQWLARDLIGYGTVSGLAVGIESDATGPRVAVSPGVAVSPRGQLIRVKPKQCASLNAWLKKTAVKEQIPIGTSTLPVYVVLCYRDCPVDEVPILGEPCRTEEETMAPSRVADDFHLELRLTPPDQREEDAIRIFVAWLKQIEVADFPSGDDELKQFVDTIEAMIPAAPQEFSPPESPLDFLFQSPPAELRIPAAELCEYLRTAFRLWVTRLRPLAQFDWSLGTVCQCGSSEQDKPANEECLLLAELQLPLLVAGSDWVIDGTREILKDESRRPWLLHLRVLQEWMLCGCNCEGSNHQVNLEGDVTGPANSTTVESIRNIEVDVTGLADNQVMAYDSAANKWSPADLPQPATQLPTAENVFSPTVVNPSLGSSPRFALEDHTHGLPPDPIPAHVGHTQAHNAHLIGGDVTGTLAAAQVSGILGAPISNTPQEGFVLKFRTTPTKRWMAEADQTGGPTGEFVEHTKDAGRYLIVAAGFFDSKGNPAGAIYNNLTATPVISETGRFTLKFGASTGDDASQKYVQPVDGSNFMYIVKGTSFGKTRAIFHVIEFHSKGIAVQVLSTDNDTLPEAFMIEISLYGKF